MSRFSKTKLVGYLHKLQSAIISVERFSRYDGTSQLGAKNEREKELVRKAVQYGRADAFEQITQMIQENSPDLLNFNPDEKKA